MSRSRTSRLIGLRLADLELWLDARESGMELAVPTCHMPFLLEEGRPARGLKLRVRDGTLRGTEGWESVFRDGDSWQLWRDTAGCRVFVPPVYSPPPRQVTVDPSFTAGEVLGEFGRSMPSAQRLYPLESIDIRLYANWLAETGDLILHAAGIADEGAGYVFVGPSGAGKSTLVGQLAGRFPATVLGEDQVILRYQQGQFLVYGTPWHFDPARCSPGGVPLAKLFFLDRSDGHGIEPCGPRAGVEYLLQNALIPYYNRTGVERILDTLPQLAEQVPLYVLGFQIGADAMGLIRDA